jgi:hypothetical protein
MMDAARERAKEWEDEEARAACEMRTAGRSAGAPSVRLSAIGAIFLIATLLFVSLFSAEMTTPYAPAQGDAREREREREQRRGGRALTRKRPAPAVRARQTHRAPAP